MLPPEKLERHPLTVCLRILQGLGKPGEYVWRYSKEIPGLEQRMAYLRDAIAWLRVKAGETIWRELPVDFRTFTESAQLLNKKGVLWPRVIECGSEINSGPDAVVRDRRLGDAPLRIDQLLETLPAQQLAIDDAGRSDLDDLVALCGIEFRSFQCQIQCRRCLRATVRRRRGCPRWLRIGRNRSTRVGSSRGAPKRPARPSPTAARSGRV